MKDGGYLLSELIIVIALVSIMASVILLNQSKFNRESKLIDLTHEIAFIFREAQLQAVNVRRSNDDNLQDPYDVSYGVFIDINENTFTQFSDENGNNFYDSSDDTNLGEVSLPQGFDIDSFCYADASGGDSCAGDRAYAIYQRPSLAANLIVHDRGWKRTNRFVIGISADDSNTRYVVVESSGQIYTYVN